MPLKTDQPRVVIIGWDGVPPRLAFDLARSGTLPEVARLMNEGSSGTLLSTIPPLTAPAWATFATGKNPAKHGMFDFLAPPRFGYLRSVCDYTYLKAATIWQYLSAQDFSVGTLNLPLTFPPERVKGFMVPGMLTPQWKKTFVHPPSLWEELEKVIGGYRIEMDSNNFVAGKEREMLADLAELTTKRTQAILYLLEKHPVDLFAAIYTGIDRIMHFLWHFMDEQSSDYDAGAEPWLHSAITDHLKVLDGALGAVRSQLRDEDVLMLLSDHGFGPVLGDFDLAKFLYEKGYLVFLPGYGPGEEGATSNPQKAFSLVKKIDFLGLRKLLPRNLREKGRQAIIAGTSLMSRIDWSQTTAYPGTSTQYAVYINTRGREPQGVVEKGREYNELRDRLIADLMAIPAAGGGMMLDRVILREDAYAGTELGDAPDLYLPLWEKGIRVVEFSDDPLVRPTRKRSGEHRREGVLAVAGAGILPGGKLSGARMADVFPTTAYLLGAQIPNDLDGSVLPDLFPKGRLEANPPHFTEAKSREGTIPVKERIESEEIKERLKGMGYLS